jgi:cell division protein FtsL
MIPADGPYQEQLPSNVISFPAVRRKTMRPSFKVTLLFGVAMVILMLLVYHTMELSRVNSEHLTAAAELQKLKTEESILIRRAEAGLSMSEVEAYAIGELGMAYPSREQFVYIGTPTHDHAVVVQSESVWGKWKQVFSAAGVRIGEFLD